MKPSTRKDPKQSKALYELRRAVKFCRGRADNGVSRSRNLHMLSVIVLNGPAPCIIRPFLA